MFTVGMKVKVVRDMGDGWGPSAGSICQVVRVHPDQPVFWITPLKSDGTLGSGVFWTDEADVKIIKEDKMTLGEKLRNIMKAETEALLAEERRARESEDKRIAALRKERADLIAKIEKSIVKGITNGYKPTHKITSTDLRAWVNACRLGLSTTDKDLWKGLVDWMTSESLRVKVSEEWDGAGVYEWLVVSVEPMRPEVEAD